MDVGGSEDEWESDDLLGFVIRIGWYIKGKMLVVQKTARF